MLIIPLEKSIDWRKPPVITFLLIIINTIILVWTQSHNEKVFQTAFDYYINSALPKTELPRYLEIKANIADDISNQELAKSIKNKSLKKNTLVYVLMAMENDQSFMKKLHQNQIITEQEQAYSQWKSERGKFETLFQQNSSSRYGFTPSQHKAITFISHMFLHGGYDHLIGNMIFLFLIGVTLETALGSLLYLACYLIAGLGAVSLYWLIYASSETTLVGASGAIAGLMGMYAGVFGLRKIRFFYYILFYFDYIKAPALIMLPLWVLNEIYQLAFTEGSNVAYMAHVGGLLTGGIISFTIKKYFVEQINTEYLDESQHQEEKKRDYEQGMSLLRELKIPQAQRVFAGLCATCPEDMAILLQYYKAMKYTPQAEEYPKVVNKIFSSADKLDIQDVLSIFKDFTKSFALKEISTAALIRLSSVFSKNNYLTEAESIIKNLLQNSTKTEGMEQALWMLTIAWKRVGNMEKHTKYLNFLVKNYPDTLGKDAQNLLDNINKLGF